MMNNFLHDLKDPGANWCPVCGEPRGVCQCTDEAKARWSDREFGGHLEWDADEPSSYWWVKSDDTDTMDTDGATQ